MYHFSSTGEESNLTKLGNGGGKSGNAQQKRQEYKAPRTTPQSLEFTVKKPVPIVQEPKSEKTSKSAIEEQQKTFQDLLDQKKVLDLLEVPSRFQNPNRKTVESENEVEKPSCLSSPSSTDTLTDHSEKSGTEEEVGDGDKMKSSCQSTGAGEEVGDGDKMKSSCQPRDETDNDHKTPRSDEIDQECRRDEEPVQTAASQVTEMSPGVSLHSQQTHCVSQDTGGLRSPPPKSLMPKTAPQNLEASYVDRRKPSKIMAHSSVATITREKSEPQLMKIRKIDSFVEGRVRNNVYVR
jgi:hypothetical protein